MRSDSRLTPLQESVLSILAGISARWTLTGGAALAGFYFAHRTTRDLDLFWSNRGPLREITRSVIDALRAADLVVEPIHGSASFQRLRVTHEEESIDVDLVTDTTPRIEPPSSMSVASTTILVDSLHEILVNKLTAVLSRAELRDLIDIRELLGNGGDLRRGLTDAPRKDAGFSPLTLVWVLKDLPIEAMSRAQDMDAALVLDLLNFRDRLVQDILLHAEPDE